MPSLDLPPLLIHGAFFVSLTTIAGLVAVWSAMSPRHRLLRLAGFCALPVALWLAPAHELAGDVLLEMAAIAVLIVVLRFVARAPYGRTWARLPKLRFGLGALFYATFLAALSVAAGSLLAPQFAGWAPEHLVRGLLDPIALSLAIVGAAYFAYAHGGRIKRLSILLVSCLTGGAAWFGLVVLSPALPGMFDVAFTVPFSTWIAAIDSRYIALVPCLIGILAAALLVLIGRGEILKTATEAQSVVSQLGARVRFGLRFALFAVLALPMCFLYYELARPIATPKVDLPSPNGYDELAAIDPSIELPTITPQQRVDLFYQVRRSLATRAIVPVNYFEPISVAPYQSLRAVARAFSAAGDAARVAGDVEAARADYLDVLTLADRTQRGGIIIDMLVGSSIESMAVAGLTQLGPDLSADECRAIVKQLLDYDDQREAAEALLRRDEVYSWLANGWVGRWQQTVDMLSGAGAKTAENCVYGPRNRNQARLRVAVCDLAVRTFALEKKRLPASLDELVPSFLPCVPIDPFDGQAVKFGRETGQYSVSALGGGPGGTAPFVIVRQRAEGRP